MIDGDEMADTSAGERRPLDRATIVRAGVELADAEGVSALTMRRLAEQLGFKAMALYNHVDGKTDVVASMVDAVAAEIVEPADDREPLGAIREHAIATREALVRHPWAPGLWMATLPGPFRTAHMECVLRLFAKSGLDAETAHHGFHAVSNHVLGYTLQEQAMASGFAAGDASETAQAFLDATPESDFPHTVAHVHQHLDGDASSSFELVLDLILDGLRRRSDEGAG